MVNNGWMDEWMKEWMLMNIIPPNIIERNSGGGYFTLVWTGGGMSSRPRNPKPGRGNFWEKGYPCLGTVHKHLSGGGAWCKKISVQKIFRVPFWTSKFFGPPFLARKIGVNPTENHIDSFLRGKIRVFFRAPLFKPPKFSAPPLQVFVNGPLVILLQKTLILQNYLPRKFCEIRPMLRDLGTKMGPMHRDFFFL